MNERLQAALADINDGEHMALRVYGKIDHVDDLIAASDLVISKAASEGKFTFMHSFEPKDIVAFIGAAVTMMLGSIPQQDVYQRVMSAKTENIAARASMAGAVFYLAFCMLPIFLVYFISGLAETNRHPFDVVEGESEIVAGHMIEYSGMSFAMFFLAEYANMWLVSILAVILFLGGWLPPIDSSLLAAIQDCFAEASVELLSPAYEVQRDSSALTVPPRPAPCSRDR